MRDRERERGREVCEENREGFDAECNTLQPQNTRMQEQWLRKRYCLPLLRASQIRFECRLLRRPSSFPIFLSSSRLNSSWTDNSYLRWSCHTNGRTYLSFSVFQPILSSDSLRTRIEFSLIVKCRKFRPLFITGENSRQALNFLLQANVLHWIII